MRIGAMMMVRRSGLWARPCLVAAMAVTLGVGGAAAVASPALAAADAVVVSRQVESHNLFRPAGGVGPSPTTSSTLIEADTTTTTTTTTTTSTTTTTTTTTTMMTPTTTSTTLPSSRSCGDPTEDGAVTASDALFTLNVAVGLLVCDPCVCDIDGLGGVSATDALVGLRISIGQPFGLNCPICR